MLAAMLGVGVYVAHRRVSRDIHRSSSGSDVTGAYAPNVIRLYTARVVSTSRLQ